MSNYVLMYYQQGSPAWKQIPLTSQSFTIGRTAENDLAIDDPLISRMHASLNVDERGVCIYDRHSSNGITLGGLRIPAGEWKLLPIAEDFTIGTTTFRLGAVPVARSTGQPAVPPQAGNAYTGQAAYPQAPPSQPSRKSRLALPLIGLAILAACICLAGSGAAALYFFPNLRTSLTNPLEHLGETVTNQPGPNPGTEEKYAPPQVIDSLPASPGGGSIQDDRGVSLAVPADSLESGQQAYLERASLSPSMQGEIEKNYQVDSLVYAVRLQDGDDGSSRVELSLPAPSPDSRLAVLVDDRYLGILETPAQEGAFHVSPGLTMPASGQGYPEPESTSVGALNRYLVLTPKAGSSQLPQRNPKMASQVLQTNSEGKSCITEFWTATHCWRNTEGSVYVFWENDVPANLKDQEYLRIEDAIQAISGIMSSYKGKGFTAAAISPSNPAYLVIEAGATEPYYSFKTGNVYLPWDIVGGVADAANRCNIAHEFFHWIEDEAYVMGSAALSNPKSWWQEASAENGAFLLFPECIDQNLTKYGIVTTSANVLGFQAAPFLWEGGEQARYIHALQFYLSVCEGGANCALSHQEWTNAINNGTYPMEGAAATAYKRNAKDMGRFLLGAAPQESRGDAVLPPSVAKGSHYGDYLVLKTGGKSIWDYGMTLNQFKPAGEREVAITAKIEQGGVYPLWVGNGTGTPMGGGGRTGLPGMLEIQPGAAFWIRQDQKDPVFYPAGSTLKLGPISDKLGTGTARIVAVAPEAANTFQAKVTLADFSGDWSASSTTPTITPVDCESYSQPEENEFGTGPDELLQLFSGLGEYVSESVDSANLNQVWNGTLPEGATGSSEVAVTADTVTLHYRLEIPRKTESFVPRWILGKKSIRRSLADGGGLKSQYALLGYYPLLPLLACASWLGRRRRRSTWLALVLLLACAGLSLAGCVWVDVWGTIDVTYTFKHIEYTGPQPGASSASDDSQAQTKEIWKLSDGNVKYDMDLKVLVGSTDLEGNESEVEQPCHLVMTSDATGSISPEGTIPPPETDR